MILMRSHKVLQREQLPYYSPSNEASNIIEGELIYGKNIYDVFTTKEYGKLTKRRGEI